MNSAKDNVAAYSQIQGLDANIRGLRQANLNINQTVGLLQTANAGLNTQLSVLQKMRELSVQASNGSLSPTDRQSLNTQMLSLREEFSRIATETEFNGQPLLNGSLDELVVQTGAQKNDELNLSIESSRASDVFEKQVGTGSFQLQQTFSAASAAQLVSSSDVADIDNDGDLDLLSVHSADDFEVYLNDGAGSFSLSQRLTGSSSSSGRFADMNNDGVLDIVTTNVSSGLRVFIGNGDGSFDLETSLNEGLSAYSDARIGDFNNDGNLDVVANSFALDQFALYLGDGSGSLSFSQSFTIESSSNNSVEDIEVADLNGDGDLDLAVLASGSFDFARIETYLGDGNGNFELSSTFESIITNGTNGLDAGDLDNDGDIDLVFNSFATGAAIRVLNDGSGAFGSETSYSGDIGAPTLADFDNDGTLDLLAAGDVSGNLHFYQGLGDGSFAAAESSSSSGAYDGFAVGDLNGDGVLDIAGVNTTSDEFEVFFNGSQTESAVSDVNLSTQQKAQSSLEIIDGAIDSIIQNQISIANALNQLEVRLNQNLLNSESLYQAKSNIEDADFALETADLIKNQVLQQAQIAALSQNNQRLQVVLQLLET